MPEGVVVRLKAVEVEEHEQLVRSHQPAPVRQARQSIVVGEVFELGLETLALADVED